MFSQSSAESGKSIFISYRRDDSSANTGRIYDRLIQQFDRESIFKDVDAIPIGVDFRKHLEQQVAGCKVLLAIIGPRWAGNERLQDEGDFVRVEIEYGLDSDRDILVVPVLVGNASMPPADQLPASLKDFAFRNAIQVRPDPDFHKDMDKLIKTLTGVVGGGLGEQKQELEAKAPTHKPYRIRRREFYEPEELAVYLSENWAEGVKHLGGGLVTDWVKTHYLDQGLAIDLADIGEDKELDADQKLSVALLLMNNELPVFWRGTVANLDWLTSNPEKSVEISESRLLHYYGLYRSGDELQLGEIAKRVKEVAKDKKLEGDVRDSVVSLAVNPEQPLKLGKALITPKWMTSHQQKAIELCQSSLPKWHKRLRKETWLADLAQQIKRVLADKDLEDKAKTSVISLVSDEESPLKWGRIKITPQWLTDNPKEAIKICQSGLPVWYRQVRNEDWLEQKAKLVREAGVDEGLSVLPDAFASVIDLILDGEAPLKWKKQTVTPQWMAANPKEAVEICRSKLPEWHKRLRNEDWLEQKAKLVREADADKGLCILPDAFASVIDLILDGEAPLKWKKQTVTPQWMAANPKEAASMLESPLPDWHARLRRDQSLIELRKASQTWRARVKALGIPVDWAKVDEIVLQGEQKWAARFKSFLQKFERGEYAGSKDQRIQDILTQSEISPVEQIVLLCCDQSLFLSPEEKHCHDSIAYLKGFGEPMDWVVAEELITANNWEAISSRWQEVLSWPLRPNLKKNVNINRIFLSREALYLDVVALVATDAAATAEDLLRAGTKLWEFETGGSVASSPAIGLDGTVYVGSPDHKVYALDGQSGAKIWEFETGDIVSSSPAIGSDGTVYVGSYDKKVYALDGQSGSKKWEFETGNEVWSSPAIGSDGTVYVGSNDKKVYTLDGQSGVKKWEFETRGWVRSSPAIGSDGTVYVGSDDKKVYALNGKSGVKLWEFETGRGVSSSPAIGSEGTVYVGSNDNKLYAINGKSGVMLWEFETGGSVSSFPAIGSDGTVYVGSRDDKLYAINGQSGVKLWEFETGRWVGSSPAIGSDGTVYVGSRDKKLYAINGKSGVKLWEFETGGSVRSSPAIGPDGTVYVGSNDITVYAIASASRAPARSAWPMRGQNPQHTGCVPAK